MSQKVDLLITGTLINVQSGNLEDRTLAIDDGIIVGFGKQPSRRQIECEYISPGLINSHTHVEVSMLTLSSYGSAVIPSGVTSVITDPHEIGNVLGIDGIRQMIDDAAETPLKAYFTVPSSVPASDLQDSGADIGPQEVRTLLKNDLVVGLGEVMDTEALVEGAKDLHSMIRATREEGLVVDGHLPKVTGRKLHRAAQFLDNDHESVTFDEGREKIEAGLRLHLREGSSSKNLAELRPIIDRFDHRQIMLCTDNFYIEDIRSHGGIDQIVQTLIADGVDPVEVIQMATLHPAEEYDIPFGKPKPGAPADLVLLNDLETWDVAHVLIDGKIDPAPTDDQLSTTHIEQNTVKFDPVAAEDLNIASPEPGNIDVWVIDHSGRSAHRTTGTVEVIDGKLAANLEEDILPVSVIERHGKGGSIGNGFIHGLGLQNGALASTVAHDAHNLVVAGTTHQAMASLANHLRQTQGGIAVYDERSDSVTELPLPIAGLMSDKSSHEVATQYQSVRNAAEKIGLDHPKGPMALDTLTLEVIPELRLSNKGLVDVERMEIIEVFN